MGVYKRKHCIICKSRIDPNSRRLTLCSDKCVTKNKKRWCEYSNKLQKKKGWPNRKKWLRLHKEQRMLAYARSHAQNKGLNINITVEDITILTKCPVLGIPLFFTKGRRTHNTPTLDRIDNSKGYIKGNVVVVSWRANDLKKDATIEELRRIAQFYGESENE